MPDNLFTIALLVGLAGGGYIFYLTRRKKRGLIARFHEKPPEE